MINKIEFWFILYFYFLEASSDQLYIGCFANLLESNSIKSPVQSISQCLNECRSQISLFTAVKDGSSCYCANVTKDRVPSSNCKVSCAKSDEICGGNNFFSVYTEVPSYQGCFKDDNANRDMNLTIADDWTMTIDKCYEKCLSSKYLFMGVQNGASCFCGQQFGKHGKSPESDCNMACTGNRNQICGSPGKNSIYSVGYLPGLNKNYSEVFHCLNGLTDRYGTCINTACQPGWKGTKCNQPDCTVNNGNCGNHKCEEIKIGNQIISECVCNAGFQSLTIYDGCRDENECQSNPCNEPSETCVNTIGSFKCICSPGYNYFNQSGCEAQCIKNLTDPNCFQLPRANNQCGNEDKRIIIVSTFLALALCLIITLILVIICYIHKVRDLNTKLKELQNNIDAKDSTYNQLSNSNNPHDDHNYSDLEMKEK